MVTSRFENFTQQARLAMEKGQGIAERRAYNYFGTEHILLGICEVDDGVGARVLVNMGLSLARLTSAITMIGGRIQPPKQVPTSPRVRAAIEYAVVEARTHNHEYVDTAHLLIGVLREAGGVGAGMLELQGATLSRVSEAAEKVWLAKLSE